VKEATGLARAGGATNAPANEREVGAMKSYAHPVSARGAGFPRTPSARNRFVGPSPC
jgi:hypothetical protein